MQKRILLFVISFVFILFNSLFAGIFTNSKIGWDNGLVKITNILINNQFYWANFKYDSLNDKFILNNYGKIQSSNDNLYCRNTGLGPVCDFAKILINNKSQNFISGIIYLGTEKSENFSGSCSENLCNITTNSGCKGNFYFNNNTIQMNFTYGLNETCQSLMIFSGTFSKTTNSSVNLDFDMIASQEFLSKHNLQLPVPSIDDNDILCFNKSLCYKFNPKNLAFELLTNQEDLNYNINDIINEYTQNGIKCNYPFIKIPANLGYQVKYPVYPVDSLLYEIEMSGCPGEKDYGVFVKAYLIKQDNKLIDLGYFNHNLQLTSTPEKFIPQAYMKFYLFDKNNPLPGAVIKTLKKQNYKGFIIASFCFSNKTDDYAVDFKAFEIK